MKIECVKSECCTNYDDVATSCFLQQLISLLLCEDTNSVIVFSLICQTNISEDRQVIQLHPGPRNRVSWSTYFAYRCCSGQMLVDRPTKNGLIWIHLRIKSLTYSWLWNIIPGYCHFMRISCRNITQRPVQRIHIHFPCLRHLWSNDHVTYEKSRELFKGKLL